MIKTEKLTFGYKARRKVLNDITLELGEGHIHGLLGCNGIGKTTLLKLICGIMRPSSGSVRVDGFDPMTRKPEMFAELMIIPEEFELPNYSLERYATIMQPFYPRFDRDAMRYYATELKVNTKEKLHSMSVGEMFLGKFLSIRIMHQTKRRHGTWQKTKTTLHSFSRCE